MLHKHSVMFSNIDQFLETTLAAIGTCGPIVGCILIIVESIIPVLPLSVFITLNFYAYGNILGFIISYVLTIFGCNIAFYLCKKLLSKRMDLLHKRFSKNKVLKLIRKFNDMKLTHLATIMAFPFTPAFLINIFAGISNIKFKKFFIATLISKPFMVFFWGFLGTTLLESFKKPENFIIIAIMVILAYLGSKFINKKFDLD